MYMPKYMYMHVCTCTLIYIRRTAGSRFVPPVKKNPQDEGEEERSHDIHDKLRYIVIKPVVDNCTPCTCVFQNYLSNNSVNHTFLRTLLEKNYIH